MRVSMTMMLVFSSALSVFASVTNTTITINGSGSDTATGPNSFSYAATGAATLTGFGTASFSASGQVTVTANVAGPTSGTFTFDFGGGNTMTGTFSVPSDIVLPNLPVGGFAQATGSAAITGGTGIYAGASGNFANVSGSGISTGLTTATFTVTTTSAITLPGSASVPIGLPTLGVILLGLSAIAWATTTRRPSNVE